jgi:hypothetical protein
VNICGRNYVPHASIVGFNERAARGDFDRQAVPPTKKPKRSRKSGRATETA